MSIAQLYNIRATPRETAASPAIRVDAGTERLCGVCVNANELSRRESALFVSHVQPAVLFVEMLQIAGARVVRSSILALRDAESAARGRDCG